MLRPRPPIAQAPAGGPPKVAGGGGGPAGGATGGGINTVNGNSGNAPTTGERYRPITKLKIKPTTGGGVDSQIDYGGCGGCGVKPKDDLIVR